MTTTIPVEIICFPAEIGHHGILYPKNQPLGVDCAKIVDIVVWPKVHRLEGLTPVALEPAYALKLGLDSRIIWIGCSYEAACKLVRRSKTS